MFVITTTVVVSFPAGCDRANDSEAKRPPSLRCPASRVNAGTYEYTLKQHDTEGHALLADE